MCIEFQFSDPFILCSKSLLKFQDKNIKRVYCYTILSTETSVYPAMLFVLVLRIGDFFCIKYLLLSLKKV